MHIIVCVKQVIDPEEPPSSFSVNEQTNSIILPPGVPSVISPFDRYAVEAALRIKDDTGAQVTALSVGPSLDLNVVRDPIAMGADELVLVEDGRLVDTDSWFTATVLTGAMRQIGDFDLVLCGRQASDTDGGLVGAGIAEMLDLLCVTIAQKIDIQGDMALVERVCDEGYEIVEAALPAVITVSNELGEPRYPTIKQVMVSKKKEPTMWNLDDLNIDSLAGGRQSNRVRLRRLFQPPGKNLCEFITGHNPEEAGANLAAKLREVKVI